MRYGALSTQDVSVVVCTLNSAEAIEQCLKSARKSDVREIIVVDGGSDDGTVEIVKRYSDLLLFDKGTGLGAARALGVQATSGNLVLNLGADNVLLAGTLEAMIECLVSTESLGVSARTRISGTSYLSRCLDTYRSARYPSGRVSVIGTPTLFPGPRLRDEGFEPSRSHSDDGELCERWAAGVGGRFFICEAEVLELGQSTLKQIRSRWNNYGISDFEVFQSGLLSGWGLRRKVRSLSYPLRVELVGPIRVVGVQVAVRILPFLLLITFLRYRSWLRKSLQMREARIVDSPGG